MSTSRLNRIEQAVIAAATEEVAEAVEVADEAMAAAMVGDARVVLASRFPHLIQI